MIDYDAAPTSALAEEEISLRWRRAILRLSRNLQAAAEQRSDLAPILMEALNHALAELFERGNDHYVDVLEEWLSYDEQANSGFYQGVERRLSTDRRNGPDRRLNAHLTSL